MRTFNIAVIGCGSISQTHFDSINEVENLKLYAVVDKDYKKAKEVSHREGCLCFENYKDILTDPNIDAVHITTPHYRHKDIAMDLAKAGKHILLEKPLAETYREAVSLCEALKSYDVVSGLVYQNRFNPTVIELKKLIDGKTYGNLLGVKGILTWNREEDYYSSSYWRGSKRLEGGGVLINQGIHTIDLLQWIGGELSSTSGTVSKHKFRNGVEVEDTAEIFLGFKSGARGVFYATNNYSYNSPVEVEVHCENGILNIKNGRLRVYSGSDELLLCTDTPSNSVKDYYGSGHTELIRGFYRALDGDRSDLVTVDEGLKALKIIDNIYQ